jgi:flagellar biosynthesis/type III secretory pathway protein FliH
VLAADGFVPLSTWLAGPAPAAPEPERPDPPSCAEPPAEAAPLPAAPLAAQVELMREVRLFRARLADALAAATPQLLRQLAYAVVGRELCLAPADVAALAARIVAEHPAAEPVAIRHALGERVDVGVPAVADPALAPGDLVLVFTAGEVDARLGIRLAAALEAWP